MKNILDSFLENSGHDPDGVGIYHLKANDKVVYVGQTRNLKSRIAQHIYNNDKEFDSIDFFATDESFLNDCEAREIVEFNPVYNKNLPPNNVYTQECDLLSKVESVVKSYFSGKSAHTTKQAGHIHPKRYFYKKEVDNFIGQLSIFVCKFVSNDK